LRIDRELAIHGYPKAIEAAVGVLESSSFLQDAPVQLPASDEIIGNPGTRLATGKLKFEDANPF